MDNRKKEKRRYEAPRLYEMDVDLTQAMGQSVCGGGSTAGGGCQVGSGAVLLCRSGSSPSRPPQTCKSGSSAVGCGTGGSAATNCGTGGTASSACATGGSATRSCRSGGAARRGR